MTDPERQQIAEDELQKQAEEAGLTFAQFSERMIQLCAFGRHPTNWNDAAEMWLNFVSNLFEVDTENEILKHVEELIANMLEE